MTNVQLAHYELHLTVIDRYAHPRGRDGRLILSDKAIAALGSAVEAFQTVLRYHRFEIVHTGSGVRATETSDDEHTEIERLREALRWYADDTNYNDDDASGEWFSDDDGSDFDPDRGHRARAALNIQEET